MPTNELSQLKIKIEGKMLASPKRGGQFFCMMKTLAVSGSWLLAIIMKNSMLNSPKI